MRIFDTRWPSSGPAQEPRANKCAPHSSAGLFVRPRSLHQVPPSNEMNRRLEPYVIGWRLNDKHAHFVGIGLNPCFATQIGQHMRPDNEAMPIFVREACLVYAAIQTSVL